MSDPDRPIPITGREETPPVGRRWSDPDAVTLLNVADGEAEDAFQEALAEVAALASRVKDSEEIKLVDKKGWLSCRLEISVAFEVDKRSGTVMAAVTSKLRMPTRSGAAAPLLIRDGAAFVEPTGEQRSLFRRDDD